MYELVLQLTRCRLLSAEFSLQHSGIWCPKAIWNNKVLRAGQNSGQPSSLGVLSLGNVFFRHKGRESSAYYLLSMYLYCHHLDGVSKITVTLSFLPWFLALAEDGDCRQLWVPAWASETSQAPTQTQTVRFSHQNLEKKAPFCPRTPTSRFLLQGEQCKLCPFTSCSWTTWQLCTRNWALSL